MKTNAIANLQDALQEGLQKLEEVAKIEDALVDYIDTIDELRLDYDLQNAADNFVESAFNIVKSQIATALEIRP